MSGSVNNYWAMSENNNHVEIAYQIARDLEQPKNTYQELVDFLKLVPSDIFNDYSALADAPTVLFNILLTPVIEREYLNQIKCNYVQTKCSLLKQEKMQFNPSLLILRKRFMKQQRSMLIHCSP